MDHTDNLCTRRPRRRQRALDALPGRAAPSAAFVDAYVPGTFDQVELLRRAVREAGFTARERQTAERFLVHLLASTGRKGDGFVPVPSKLIERHFRGLDWRHLEECDLVVVRPHDRYAGRCREFAIAFDLRRAYFEAGPTADRVLERGLYNVVRGLPTQRRTKSEHRTPTGNALPPLVRAAIDAVGLVPVDVHAIERHLATLRAAADEATGDPARVRAEARYLNDLRCYHAVLTQGARPLDPEQPGSLWIYRPAYRPQRFGRLSQKGGGLQSCSAAMKAVAYPEFYP